MLVDGTDPGPTRPASPARARRGAALVARAETILDRLGEGTPLWSRENGWRLALFVLGVGLFLALGVAITERLPGERRLIWFSLYSCPAQMLISPFPHEPALFHVAKFYTPGAVALSATIGCFVAGLFDYLLLAPFLRSRWARRKVREASGVKGAIGLFYKSPFWMLVAAACTPLPFYPFKFLAILSGYPMHRYLLALMLGRVPKFYTLAWLGYLIMPPDWLLLTLAGVGVVFFLVKVFARKKQRLAPPEPLVRMDAENLADERGPQG